MVSNRAIAHGDAALRRLVEDVLQARPLKAGAFIVTIYGDVVVPRGGVVWIGNLIDTCAEVGINESLVRTATSRLVAAGRLAGEREGRRSFYRLTEAAREEFAAAAAQLFAAGAATGGWRFVHLAGPRRDAMEALERAGYARLAPGLAVAPEREGLAAVEGALVFRAEAAGGAAALRAFAAEHWDLEARAAGYARFIAAFEPLDALLAAGHRPEGKASLTARLLLVDHFRVVALADPALPAAALPERWPGAAARRLFARLYRRLSGPADSHVAAAFGDAAGPLAVRGDAVAQRLTALAAAEGR